LITLLNKLLKLFGYEAVAIADLVEVSDEVFAFGMEIDGLEYGLPEHVSARYLFDKLESAYWAADDALTDGLSPEFIREHTAEVGFYAMSIADRFGELREAN
jgi:hypothetical protein